MPKSLMQYRVFIASPGGLQVERERFRELLEKYTKLNAEPRGVTFFPVGWEDTIGGVGRPQELINEELKQCDYAVFVLHDRWGTPPGAGHSSGTEEEWKLAEELYAEAKIRNIALFFKDVDARQLSDPGAQLTEVLKFKKSIEAGRKYLFKTYVTPDKFCDGLEGYLAKWLRDHEGARSTPGSGGGAVSPSVVAAGAVPTKSAPSEPPSFDFWITEAVKLLDANADSRSDVDAAFCAKRAVAVAGSEVEWARANNALGVAYFRLKKSTESLAIFNEIARRLDSAGEINGQMWVAKALFNAGSTLSQLGRSEEAIAVYDDVVARFGAAPDAPLREHVAGVLVNKGVTFGELRRSEEAIAVYDDVTARFGAAPEAPLREQVARALVNKGVILGELKRSEDAIAVYDDVVARFGTALEAPLRERVAGALVNKGVMLGELKRNEDAIAVYDDVVARFGNSEDDILKQIVGDADRLRGHVKQASTANRIPRKRQKKRPGS
jgi:tetratricopeptide (TPR) repeat protein